MCLTIELENTPGKPMISFLAQWPMMMVYTTFALYTAGVLSKEQTLEALKIKKLYDQLVFASEKALSFLNFIGTAPKEEML